MRLRFHEAGGLECETRRQCESKRQRSLPCGDGDSSAARKRPGNQEDTCTTESQKVQEKRPGFAQRILHQAEGQAPQERAEEEHRVGQIAHKPLSVAA